jgi:pantoate--beta-alanine ligase
MGAILAAEPLARTDYVSVADAETLRELDAVRGPALLSMAVQVGPARLIDNLLLDPAPRTEPEPAALVPRGRQQD